MELSELAGWEKNSAREWDELPGAGPDRMSVARAARIFYRRDHEPTFAIQEYRDIDLRRSDSAALDLKQRAESLGLDAAAFADCLDSGSYTEKVRADIAEGAKAGVRGTPNFFLGQTDPENPGRITATKFIRGARGYGAFKQAIDELLKPSS